MDKWDAYKNALRDLLTKPDGTVDMEDGTGAIVTLPTIPALETTVTSLTDDLTGAVAQAQDINSQTVASANAADASATAAATSETNAAASESAAAASETAAATSASNADASATSAASSASQAASDATSAGDSAAAASLSESSASTSAADANSYANDSATSASLSQQWADNPQNVEVTPGEYSAMHWALTAQSTVTGLLTYRGSWDASTGTYPASPNKGDFWKVGVAGTVSSTAYSVGDQIIYNGTTWDKIDNTETVTSVAGRVGDVTLSNSDISGLGSLATKNSASISDVTGLQTSLDAKALQTDVTNSLALKANLSHADFTGNLTTTLGMRAAGSPTNPGSWIGGGVEVYYYTDNTGQILCYDRSAQVYKPMNVRGEVVTLQANGVDILTAQTGGVVLNGTLNGNNTIFAPVGDFSNYVISRTMMYVIGPFRRRNVPDTAWVDQPRIFVQSGDPGANAGDGDLWIW